jgi:K+-transporting ATPase A subunit
MAPVFRDERVVLDRLARPVERFIHRLLRTDTAPQAGTPWDVSFNTAISFVSNTRRQFYAGERTLSPFALA